MIELLIATIGLGIAGIDPVGALIAIAALSNGARERHVVAYGVAVVIVTAVLGTVLSLIVGSCLAEIDWSFLDSGPRFWAIGEAVAGASLLIWGGMRLLRRSSSDAQPRDQGTSAYALIGVGITFGLTAVLDPTFVSLVVLAGRDGALFEAGIAHLLWILISQAPLVIVTAAVIRGQHQPVIGWFQWWWQRLRPGVARIGTGLALLAGLILLADAGWWFATGEFLIQV